MNFSVSEMVQTTLLYVVIIMAVTVPLERLAPVARHGFFRKGMWTDAAHLFLTGRLADLAYVPLLAGATVLLKPFVVPESWQAVIAAQPTFLQVLEALLLADLGGYWAHRMAHEIKPLWRLHSVHHSPTKLDWLATPRQHPIDAAIKRTFKFAPVFLIGFDFAAIAWFAAVSFALGLYVFTVHANNKINLGFFEWLHITTRYNHWHHALDPINKNYADQFPLLDWVFGSMHLPKDGSWPDGYGTHAPVPENWFLHMLHPFNPKARFSYDLNAARAPEAKPVAAAE